MDKVGDKFEKSVDLPDSFEKIYYKVGTNTHTHKVSTRTACKYPLLPHPVHAACPAPLEAISSRNTKHLPTLDCSTCLVDHRHAPVLPVCQSAALHPSSRSSMGMSPEQVAPPRLRLIIQVERAPGVVTAAVCGFPTSMSSQWTGQPLIPPQAQAHVCAPFDVTRGSNCTPSRLLLPRASCSAVFPSCSRLPVKLGPNAPCEVKHPTLHLSHNWGQHPGTP